MDNGDRRFRGRHAHFNFFLQARQRLNWRSRDETVFRDMNFDRNIVGRPRRNGVFRGLPDSISAAQLELLFFRASHLFRVLFEEVLSSQETKADDPRPNVSSDNDLDFSVAHPIAVGPSNVALFLRTVFSTFTLANIVVVTSPVMMGNKR